MKVKVEIKTLAGETGLRLPGSSMLMDDKKAKGLAKRKLVIIYKEKKPAAKSKSNK